MNLQLQHGWVEYEREKRCYIALDARCCGARRAPYMRPIRASASHIAHYNSALIFDFPLLQWYIYISYFYFQLIAYFVNLIFLGHAFTLMLVYVWSRRNPLVRMNFFGVINFQVSTKYSTVFFDLEQKYCIFY